MRVREVLLPANYHAAVESWRDMYLPDYQYLIDNWDKYFPKDPIFKLCAFRRLHSAGHIVGDLPVLALRCVTLLRAGHGVVPD